MIYFENTRCENSWVNPSVAFTLTTRLRCLSRKTIFWTWWYRKTVLSYQLLQPGETVSTKPCKQQFVNLNLSLFRKRMKYLKQEHKVIAACVILDPFIQQNRFTIPKLEAIDRQALRESSSSTFDYHLLVSLEHALAEQRFIFYKSVRKWLSSWFDLSQKSKHFLNVRSTNRQVSEKNVQFLMGNASNEIFFSFPYNMYFL